MNDKHGREIVELIIPMYKDKITTLDLEMASGDLIRCKDCKHRGNYKKCVLSAISEENDFPLFMLDNHGYWFCADGERKK